MDCWRKDSSKINIRRNLQGSPTHFTKPDKPTARTPNAQQGLRPALNPAGQSHARWTQGGKMQGNYSEQCHPILTEINTYLESNFGG